MIFVHSGFRTASTYLWSCFRKAEHTISYYEVFHETLRGISRAEVTAVRPELWHSKHPPSAPYFLEYLPLLREKGGIEEFHADMSYARFIPPEGCGGAISEAEVAYINRLIMHAEERGRTPVLTATRSLGRVRGLSAALPGLHLLIYRNVFHQWCSFTEQGYGGNHYFLDKLAEIIRACQHEPMVRDIERLFPIGGASFDASNTFYAFVFLHLHLYVQVAGGADQIIDVNRLANDPAHAREIESRIAEHKVTIDLSAAKSSIGFSLCRLGSTADVSEQLKVIGEIVIDRAPDAAGRQFGTKVLADLIADHRLYDFQAGALRSIFLNDREASRLDQEKRERRKVARKTPSRRS